MTVDLGVGTEGLLLNTPQETTEILVDVPLQDAVQVVFLGVVAAHGAEVVYGGSILDARGTAGITPWVMDKPSRGSDVANGGGTLAADDELEETVTADSPTLEAALMEELSDVKWAFRTVEGLADAIGVPAADVDDLLGSNRDLVRWVPARDARGRQLLAPAARQPSMRERLISLRAFVAKTTY